MKVSLKFLIGFLIVSLLYIAPFNSAFAQTQKNAIENNANTKVAQLHWRNWDGWRFHHRYRHHRRVCWKQWYRHRGHWHYYWVCSRRW